MDVTKMWDYRVVRKESEDGSDEWYSIQEVYYDEGKPMAQSIDLQVEGDTITGMRTQLKNMLEALDEPVLDESDIVDDTNTEIREEIGEDGHGNKMYVYESPDGGETIFRREFGNSDEREKIKSPSLKVKVLKLEMENTEMRDRLRELGDEIEDRGL